MNCSSLCEEYQKLVNHNDHGIHRFHWTCLTCPKRIFHYRRRGWERYVKKKRITLIFDSIHPEGIVQPKRYVGYFIFINLNDAYSPIGAFKNAIVKRLLTLAEFVGQI